MGRYHNLLAILAVVLYGRSCHGQTLETLSSSETGQLVGHHNRLRGMLEGGNMQCITGYDTTLQALAEAIALNCTIQGVRDTTSNGLAFFFKLQPDTRPTMEEFIEDIYTGVNAYDYVQTTCLDAVPCQSFLSFAWFENTKIGCALATCQAVQGAPMAARQQYFGVCAYDRKADLTARPYVAPPSCQFCPNDASICSNNLCCPYDLNAMTCPSVGGVGAGSGGSPPDGLIDLYYISRTPSKIAYATNATEVQELITIGAVSHGIIGKVAAAGNDASKCGVLKPIYHLYSPHFRCNYYIVDEYLVRVRMDEGYEYKGILGYAVRGINACGASLAIYEFFRHSDGITQVPNSTDVLTMMSERSGYIYHGISFAVWR